jgi:hypothetical protein
VDRWKWRKITKSTNKVWCYRHKKSDCLRRDATLIGQPRTQTEGQKDRGTRVTACTTSSPK